MTSGGESQVETYGFGVTLPLHREVVSNNIEHAHKCIVVFPDCYSSSGAWMISNVEKISAVGLKVAATLQYLVSESSMACAIECSQMLRPVTIWCTSSRL